MRDGFGLVCLAASFLLVCFRFLAYDFKNKKYRGVFLAFGYLLHHQTNVGYFCYFSFFDRAVRARAVVGDCVRLSRSRAPQDDVHARRLQFGACRSFLLVLLG